MTLRIAVVTVARSDYGILYPILKALRVDDAMDLQLIVAAAHLDPKFGNTVEEIERDGFAIASRVPIKMAGDSRLDVALAIGAGIEGFAAELQQIKPDLLLLLGDRYETFAAAIAALPLRIPIAHLHGGELTYGAIDDAMRHAITKLSHIHFAASDRYAQRIRQMGEEPWRIHNTGSPAIDSIMMVETIEKAKLDAEFGLDLSRTLLITYHPVTLDGHSSEQVSNLLAAVEASDCSLLFTYPNADSDNDRVIELVKEFVRTHDNARLLQNLGHRRYHNVQKYAAAMVGNSSSGIIEAASFRLPVVNVGSRQAGRIRASNVIDVGGSREEIARGIQKALSPEFREKLRNLRNPYGDGGAAAKILAVLKNVKLGPDLLMKKFVDQPVE